MMAGHGGGDSYGAPKNIKRPDNWQFMIDTIGTLPNETCKHGKSRLQYHEYIRGAQLGFEYAPAFQ